VRDAALGNAWCHLLAQAPGESGTVRGDGPTLVAWSSDGVKTV
jgi:hypothetical protein